MMALLKEFILVFLVLGILGLVLLVIECKKAPIKDDE